MMNGLKLIVGKIKILVKIDINQLWG